MSRQRHFTGVMLALYCLLLLWVILLKGSFSLSQLPWFALERKVNFVPFYHPYSMRWLELREIILNFLLFAPFGFYLRMLDVSPKKAIILGFAFSLALELFQLGFAVGACDITDLLTNTLGTVAGVFLYALAEKIIPNRKTLHRTVNILTAVALGNLVLLSIPLWLANRAFV